MLTLMRLSLLALLLLLLLRLCFFRASNLLWEAPTSPKTFSILQVGVVLHPMEEEKGEIGLTKNLLKPAGDSAAGYPTSLKRGAKHYHLMPYSRFLPFQAS